MYNVIDFLIRVYEFVIDDIVLFDVYDYLNFLGLSFSFFIYLKDNIIVVRELEFCLGLIIDIIFYDNNKDYYVN